MQKVLKALAKAGERAGGGAGVEENATVAENIGVGTTPTRPGAISSRQDAVETLDRVCAWLERNDPSNPAPLLIRRSQRLMSKNFLEIIRDLAPDTVDQIEKLAGIEHP